MQIQSFQISRVLTKCVATNNGQQFDKNFLWSSSYLLLPLFLHQSNNLKLSNLLVPIGDDIFVLNDKNDCKILYSAHYIHKYLNLLFC